jgi:hypothetical protein
MIPLLFVLAATLKAPEIVEQFTPLPCCAERAVLTDTSLTTV